MLIEMARHGRRLRGRLPARPGRRGDRDGLQSRQYLPEIQSEPSSLLAFATTIMLIYTTTSGLTADTIYTLCFLIGLGVGYWAVLVTMAAEQFGTNIRGTVATTVPNFVRGSAVFAIWGFAAIKDTMGVPQAALTVGAVCFGLAFLGLFFINEN